MWKVEILLTFEPIDKIKFTQRTQNTDRKENFRSILWTNWCCDNQPSFHLKDRNAMSVSTCFASSLKTVGSKVTIRGIHRPCSRNTVDTCCTSGNPEGEREVRRLPSWHNRQKVEALWEETGSPLAYDHRSVKFKDQM